MLKTVRSENLKIRIDLRELIMDGWSKKQKMIIWEVAQKNL